MKIRIAKFQGPISPPRYQEPAQIVRDIPPTHIPKTPDYASTEVRILAHIPKTPDYASTEVRILAHMSEEAPLAFLNEDNNYGQ